MTSNKVARHEMNFMDFAQEQGLDRDDYPFAEKGPRLYSLARLAFVWFITFFVLWVIVKLWPEGLLSRLLEFGPPLLDQAQTPMDETAFHASNLVTIGLDAAYRFISVALNWLVPVSLFVFIVTGGIYLSNVMRRSRMFERDIIKNDREALSIKNKMLNQFSINRRISDKKKAISKANENGNSSSIADEDELEALTSFKNCSLMVNTRQDVYSDEILKRYHLTFYAPSTVDAEAKLDNMMGNVQNVFAKSIKGRVNIGSMVMSSDRSERIFEGEIHVDDKYDKPVDTATTNEDDNKKTESSFSLDLLESHVEENKKKEAAAIRWANANASVVDGLLATSKIESNRDNISVSATTALITYRIPRGLGISDNQQLASQFDSNFGVKGTTIKLSSNRLLIVLPLPKSYHKLIDVPTMYKEAFF